MNLTTQKVGLLPNELEAISRMSITNQPFVQAKNSEKIIQMDIQVARLAIFKEMIFIAEHSGENKKYADDPIMVNVSKLMYDYICNNYKGITLEEVRCAFKSGITKEYGDYFGYGVATFSKFIKGYMTSVKREIAMKEWIKCQEITTTNKPTTDFLKQNTEILNEFFDLYSDELAKRMDNIYTNNDKIYHLPSIYDYLRDVYIIEFTTETKDKLIKAAKLRYYHYMVNSGLPKHKQKDFDLLIYNLKSYEQTDQYKLINGFSVGMNRTYDFYVKSEALKCVISKLKRDKKTISNLRLKETNGAE